MKKDLICINLHKTLLNDNLLIDDYTIRILNKCKEYGSDILINSSHSYTEFLRYKDKISPNFISCFNGNYILSDEEVYIYNPLDVNYVKDIINKIITNEDELILECLNINYRNRLQKYDFIKSEYFDMNNVDIKDCFSIIIFPKSVNYIKNVCMKFNLKLVYCEYENYYKIFPKNSDKSNAIELIRKKFPNKYNIISFGNNASDYKTLEKSDVGIKMENSNGLNDINFWTSNNNDNGVAKFLNNFYNFNLKVDYSKIKILDCTLRDGGHLNDCKFGYNNVLKIITNLANSGVDIIEIGFLENCVYDKNKTRFNLISEANELLEKVDLKNSIASLLVQVDKYDINKLEECKGNVKMIRVSFHKDLMDDGIKYCESVIKKGYICSINPINFSGYSNLEIIKLMKKVNKINVDYFCIVDTFGLLLNNDFNNKLDLISNLIRQDINIGLHLHDNLSSSFSTTQILMQKSKDKNIIIDSSLLGMGRDPGNLKTELITYFLNMSNEKKYNMDYIYELIENEILTFKKTYNWGCDFSYSISAFEKAHRTYAEYLKNKKMGYKKIEKCIKMIPHEHKVRYNEEIIESILKEVE